MSSPSATGGSDSLAGLNPIGSNHASFSADSKAPGPLASIRPVMELDGDVPRLSSQRLDPKHEPARGNELGCAHPASGVSDDRLDEAPAVEKSAVEESVSRDREALEQCSADNESVGPQALHRVRVVREQQGVSLRSMAKRLNIDIPTYREMEDPLNDLSMSELRRLQETLDVPLCDLLDDRETLSRQVEERAKLIRIMKTATALKDSAAQAGVKRMCEMLCEQLIDLMPELAEVSAWPQYGGRRGKSAVGRALTQQIDMSDLRVPD